MYNLIKPAIHNCLHLLVHLQQGTVWFHLFPYLFQLLVLIRNHRHLADDTFSLLFERQRNFLF